MRKALNDNPVARIAVVGVLLAVVGFLAMRTMSKDSDSAPVTSPVAEGSTIGSAEPSSSATATVVPSVTPTSSPAAAPGTSAPPVVPGPPLPRQVTVAQQAGKVLVLLVVRAGGPDDRLLRGAVAKLRSVPGLAFFATRAKGIARFARITQGAKVDRVPALIVVRPPPAGATVATAEVRYGFRDAESVVQAVRDALYRGPAVGYSPD